MTGTSRPGGAPFVNRLPQSVIDRYDAQQKTGAHRAVHYAPDPQFAQVTACQRYLPNQPDLEHTPKESEVTCQRCRKAMDQ